MRSNELQVEGRGLAKEAKGARTPIEKEIMMKETMNRSRDTRRQRDRTRDRDRAREYGRCLGMMRERILSEQLRVFSKSLPE